jgi:hypothetical protein
MVTSCTRDGICNYLALRHINVDSDIAASCGITERAAQGIIADLEAAGYLTRTRDGRRTVYTVHLDGPFRHPAQPGLQVGPFLELLAAAGGHRAGDAAASTRQWIRPSRPGSRR